MFFRGVFMKKTVLVFAIAVIAVGMATAQPFVGRGNGFAGQAQQTVTAPAATTVTGTLDLVNGRIAIKNGSKTYYVMSLNRLVGFVDGLKEGATVTVEGYAHDVYGAKDTFGLSVNKLTIGTRVIDLGTTTPGAGNNSMRGGAGMRGGANMMGGYSHQGRAPSNYGYGMTGRGATGCNR